ncbi:Major facilitator superfamily domain general substrate transporter [Penicillium tannophilum]|nr:Major facilitator superfamily domain general substrate transporter [Penicillium tannophilum]
MSDAAEDVKAEASHAERISELITIDPVDEKNLVRKIDLYLMPSVFVLYLFSYVDRANIGLAKIAGMEEDLPLSSNGYYMSVAVWVIGYTCAAVPSK